MLPDVDLDQGPRSRRRARRRSRRAARRGGGRRRPRSPVCAPRRVPVTPAQPASTTSLGHEHVTEPRRLPRPRPRGRWRTSPPPQPVSATCSDSSVCTLCALKCGRTRAREPATRSAALRALRRAASRSYDQGGRGDRGGRIEQSGFLAHTGSFPRERPRAALRLPATDLRSVDREAGANPARTRHCDRECPAAHATGALRAPGRRGKGKPGSQETSLRPQANYALVERGWLMRNRLAGLVAGTLILSALVPGLAQCRERPAIRHRARGRPAAHAHQHHRDDDGRADHDRRPQLLGHQRRVAR